MGINQTLVENTSSVAVQPITAPPADQNPPGILTSIPVIGSVLSTVGSAFSFFANLIKGTTKHATWDEANKYSLQFAAGVESAIRNAVTLEKFNAIGENYRQRMINYLTTIDRWGEGFPQNKAQIINNLKGLPTSKDLRSRIFLTTWLWAMWSFQNVDADSADEWNLIAKADLNNTLAPAIKDVTGETVSFGAGVPTSGSSGNPIAGSGVTVSGAGSGVNLSSFGSGSTLVVIVAIVLLSIFFFKR
jgi:hypothetical protein